MPSRTSSRPAPDSCAQAQKVVFNWAIMTIRRDTGDESRTAAPQQPNRSASVRANLIGLVVACLLPGAIASAVVLGNFYVSGRAQLERDTIQTARALMQAVDGTLVKAETAAQALATSEHLAAPDLAAFYAQARNLLQKIDVGNNFVLSDATGQQLVNTLRPFPGPLPRHGNPEQLHRVFETGRPVVSDIYIGGVLRRPVMSIDVPVPKNGKVAYDLSVGLFPERLDKILSAQRLPPDWVVSVFDSQGVIVARTHAAEQFVGRKGAPALVQRMTEVGEDVVETTTLEGIPVSAIFSRSAVSGWTVAIGIPAQTFATALRQRFVQLLIAVAVLLAGGIALALLLGERIARSIRALTAPALALGSGEPVAIPRVHLREAAEVATAIGTAADLIARRTMELEASNKELEELSYAISHDLTTPLRAIAGFSQIIAEEHGSQIDAEGLRLLDRVRKNTVRMGRLIDSLTGYISIMRRSLVAETVDMGQLLNEVFEELRAAAPGRTLSLQADGLPPARGDRAMLRWVLEIILSNSIKFIPPSSAGVIVVTGEISGAEIVYHVSDNGVGFDMRYANKLFEVFERLHSPGEFEGIGIGLAIVKRIVGRHGGRVWAEGRVGAGATIHFALPQ